MERKELIGELKKYAEQADGPAAELLKKADMVIECLQIEVDALEWAHKHQLINIEKAMKNTINEFQKRLKCGVPEETGVIRCADVDRIAQKMTEECEQWWNNEMDRLEDDGGILYECHNCGFKYVNTGSQGKGLKYCPECGENLT